MLIAKGKPQRFPEINGKIETMRYPAYVEPKIDGITNWLIVPSLHDPTIDDIEGPYLINGNGKILSDLPITNEIQMLSDSYKLLGELCFGEGKAGDFYKIKGASDNELKFMVFDVDLPLPYVQRHRWLRKHVKTTNHVVVVENFLSYSAINVMYFYGYLVNVGYEGAVVKSHDSRLIMGPCPWVKIKKKETLDLKVAEISSTQERIEVLHDNKRVGVKCLNKDKANLKVGDVVEIEHQGVLSGDGLRHPVFLRKRDDKCVA